MAICLHPVVEAEAVAVPAGLVMGLYLGPEPTCFQEPGDELLRHVGVAADPIDSADDEGITNDDVLIAEAPIVRPEQVRRSAVERQMKKLAFLIEVDARGRVAQLRRLDVAAD